jgi:integrase/recombinase XerD
VTRLRQKMLEELERRIYSHRTAKTYVRIVRDFAEYFHQPLDKLGPEQIRQYQAYLFQSKKLAPATVSQYVSAPRFLFIKTLHRHFLAEYRRVHSISEKLTSDKLRAANPAARLF